MSRIRTGAVLLAALATALLGAATAEAQNARAACESAARALVRQQTSWDDNSRSFGGDTLRWRASNGTRGYCKVDDRGRVYDVRVESWAQDDDIIVWPDPAQGLTEEEDYDRRGNDYRNYRGGSLSQCQETCRNDRQCRAYSYSRREQRCWLKSRANARQFARDMVTGYKTSEGSPGGGGGNGRITEERGEDRRGADYTDFRADGLRDCQDACLRDGRCRAYTFDTRTRACYLKSQVPQPVRDGQMITGYKN